MAHRSWNESYATGEPEPLLVEFVSSGRVQPARAMEIGAGTGTNSIWLAESGFEVRWRSSKEFSRCGQPNFTEGRGEIRTLNPIGKSICYQEDTSRSLFDMHRQPG